MDRNKAFRGGTGGGFVRVRGVGGVVRGKENHYATGRSSKKSARVRGGKSTRKNSPKIEKFI